MFLTLFYGTATYFAKFHTIPIVVGYANICYGIAMGSLIQAPYYNHRFQELLQNYGKSMGQRNPYDSHIAYEQAQHFLYKQYMGGD